LKLNKPEKKKKQKVSLDTIKNEEYAGISKK